MTSKAATHNNTWPNFLLTERGGNKIADIVVKNLPKGFKETMAYGRLTKYIPRDTIVIGAYPSVSSICTAKNFIALYHMGLYASLPRINGLYLNIPNIAVQNWIWGNPVYGLRNPNIFPMI